MKQPFGVYLTQTNRRKGRQESIYIYRLLHSMKCQIVISQTYGAPKSTVKFNLKGVLAKNERGYRLNAIKKRF